MNQLEAALTAIAFRDGRAVRSANFAHRRLIADPMVLVVWQLGSEPFSPGAIGFGRPSTGPQQSVPGEPRNRDLAFAALLEFGSWFLPEFEAPAAQRGALVRGTWVQQVSVELPQIVVANQATVDAIGRIGRRLAYLRTDGDRPAPEELIRLGRHLMFLARHAELPGQQLIVPMADYVGAHWVTPQSELERASFPALEAFVDPPTGLSAFEAAEIAELAPAGPLPTGDDDEALEPLLEDLNAARARRTDAATVRPLLAPIHGHYRPLVRRTWDLITHALDRERAYPEAPSVRRRWDVDREEYTRHIEWTSTVGYTRTRQTARQAIQTMGRMEDAKARLVAEEALDDPLRMIPWLLDGKAVEGDVVDVDPDHQEVANVRAARRPLVTIRTPAERPMPIGKKVWRSTEPSKAPWVVHAVASTNDGGSLVTLKRTSGSETVLPRTGETVCFSIHHFESSFGRARLGRDAPWPLRPAAADADPGPIEAAEGETP